MIQLPKMWAACLKIGEKSGTNPGGHLYNSRKHAFYGSKAGMNYYATFSMLSLLLLNLR